MDIKKKLGYWITAALVILAGVLLIIIGSKTDSQKAVDTLDMVIGILLILEGACGILVSILAKKRFVSALSLFGAFSLSLGIYALVKSFINTFLVLFLDFVPYLMIVIGSLMVLQALITYFLGKKKDLPLFIIQLIYGILMLTFGILGLTVFKEIDTKFIILGIVLCVYATYIVIGSFMPGALVIITKEEPEEAEVIETTLNNDEE